MMKYDYVYHSIICNFKIVKLFRRYSKNNQEKYRGKVHSRKLASILCENEEIETYLKYKLSGIFY